MNKIKSVLDREPISSEFIQSKQDFDEVLEGVKAESMPVWKSSWFFGVVGTASIVMTISVISIDSISLTEGAQTSSKLETTKTPTNPEIKATLAVNDDRLNEADQELFVEPELRPVLLTGAVDPSEIIPDEPDPSLDKRDDSQQDMRVSQESNLVKKDWSMYPKVGGVYSGPISTNILCSGVGIETHPDWAVTSFRIGFFNGVREVEQDVRGNKFPAEICQVIEESKTPEIITITKIKAEHRVTGKTTFLNSMNIEATPTD